jgi:hypothetical protein
MKFCNEKSRDAKSEVSPPLPDRQVNLHLRRSVSHSYIHSTFKPSLQGIILQFKMLPRARSLAAKALSVSQSQNTTKLCASQLRHFRLSTSTQTRASSTQNVTDTREKQAIEQHTAAVATPKHLPDYGATTDYRTSYAGTPWQFWGRRLMCIGHSHQYLDEL